MGIKEDNPENEWLLAGPTIAFIIIGLVGGWFYTYKHFESTFAMIAITLIIGAGGFFIGGWLGLLLIALFGKEPELFGYAHQRSKTEDAPKGDKDSYNTNQKYYTLLESRPQDDFNTIKNNYRRLVRQYHPDHLGANASEAMHKYAKEMSQKINEAFEIIKKHRKVQ